MKITKRQLRRIIKEELSRALLKEEDEAVEEEEITWEVVHVFESPCEDDTDVLQAACDEGDTDACTMLSRLPDWLLVSPGEIRCKGLIAVEMVYETSDDSWETLFAVGDEETSEDVLETMSSLEPGEMVSDLEVTSWDSGGATLSSDDSASSASEGEEYENPWEDPDVHHIMGDNQLCTTTYHYYSDTRKPPKVVKDEDCMRRKDS